MPFLLQFVRRKKAPFQKFIFFWKSASERCFLFFIYDLISRSSIRRTAAFLSPLFSEILRPDRTSRVDVESAVVSKIDRMGRV